jgi:WD40 repeat protein
LTTRTSSRCSTHPKDGNDDVDAVAFGPGGQTLAAGSTNEWTSSSSTYLWDVATRQITATLPDSASLGVSGVAFGPDGTTLAIGDGNGSTFLWRISSH